MKFIMFNWQDRMFCDFVVEDQEWAAVVKRAPTVLLPRRKHPAVELTFAQLLKHTQVGDHAQALGFMAAYKGLRMTGTLDLWEILRS